ncbi:zinc ribbon domain-containing protein [bacterium]|nr:zinc ribbon domain-containing protein [bacterium]
MITYQYKCDECGEIFEFEQSMKDAAVEICHECKGKLRRIISGGSGFLLKDIDSGYSIHSKPTLTRCGKTETCCGSPIPCETPSCES